MEQKSGQWGINVAEKRAVGDLWSRKAGSRGVWNRGMASVEFEI